MLPAIGVHALPAGILEGFIDGYMLLSLSLSFLSD